MFPPHFDIKLSIVKMGKFLLAILLIFSLNFNEGSAARGQRVSGGRIVGGSEVKIEAIPYQVSVRFYETHICGGSILSSKFILTACHCTYPFPKFGFSVRAGSSYSDRDGSIHDVSKISEHPRYDPAILDYDASILTLMNLIEYDKFRQPIRLPFFGEKTMVGSIVATSGWGLTLNANETNTSLRIAELRISLQSECNEAFIEDGGVTSRMICAYAQGRDSCSGGELQFIIELFLLMKISDSGGPLRDQFTKKLIGIVSFGMVDQCAVLGTPGMK